MKYRRGVFVIVYFVEHGEPIYLILKRKLHWVGWEFPKGGVQENESVVDAVRREVLEETGLKFLEMKKFDFTGKYLYQKELPDRNGFIGQTFEALYAVRAKSREVVLEGVEHSSFEWANYEKAEKKLTWENQKQGLAIVHKYLIGKTYAGFRRGMTKSGKLLLAGKTEANNEKLVKEVVGKNEYVLHTVARGSPFVVVKSKEKPTKEDLIDAAVLCAKYSHDWRDNKKDVMVHWFLGKDIYKDKGMKVGTFGVRNAKEIKVGMGLLR